MNLLLAKKMLRQFVNAIAFKFSDNVCPYYLQKATIQGSIILQYNTIPYSSIDTQQIVF